MFDRRARTRDGGDKGLLLAPSLSFIWKTLMFIERCVGEWCHGPGVMGVTKAFHSASAHVPRPLHVPWSSTTGLQKEENKAIPQRALRGGTIQAVACLASAFTHQPPAAKHGVTAGTSSPYSIESIVLCMCSSLRLLRASGQNTVQAPAQSAIRG